MLELLTDEKLRFTDVIHEIMLLSNSFVDEDTVELLVPVAAVSAKLE